MLEEALDALRDRPWIGLALTLVAGYAVGRIAGGLMIAAARRLAKTTATRWDDALIESARRPLRLVSAMIVVRLAGDQLLHLSGEPEIVADRVTHTLLVVGIAWFAIRSLGVGRAWIAARVRAAGKDEMESRGLRTQLILLERVVSVIIVVFALAVALIRFDFVRSVGLSLLASAGVAGIILGFAAQKSLSGVIAGIQISVTQPVRIGDTVVIEGENGVIEEINLTYIVVRVWDGRRLVVPIAKFLDTTFQNWTKVSPEIVGAVTIQADFTTPVDRVRAALKEMVEGHSKWDGRTCTLEVTEAQASTITLRALVSSADASKNWDLRCEVREKMIAFLRDHEGGAYLPRAREESIEPRAS